MLLVTDTEVDSVIEKLRIPVAARPVAGGVNKLSFDRLMNAPPNEITIAAAIKNISVLFDISFIIFNFWNIFYINLLFLIFLPNHFR